MHKVILVIALLAGAAYGQNSAVVRPDGAELRPYTSEDIAQAEADAIAAAIAASNDAIRAATPAEFPNGIMLPSRTNGTPTYGITVDLDGSIITWVAHASPYDHNVSTSNRNVALSERSTLRHDLRMLKGVAQTNKAQAQAVDVSNTSSTAQVRSAVIDLRRELIDANDTIIELTRLVRRLLKEQNP